ncbi:hypothetical protein OH77DRAFT_1377532, partial [Trametes cingulata]
EQWDWLAARSLDWPQAKRLGKVSAFLASTYYTWAQQWSERTLLFGDRETLSEEEELRLGDAVKVRQKKSKTWYQNHGGRSNPSDVNAPERGRDVPLPRVKGTRALQPTEVYSKRYYDSKMKPVVEDEIQKRKRERGVKLKLDAVERLEIIRQCTRDTFEAESSEIREEILSATAEDKARSRVLAVACKLATVAQDGNAPQESTNSEHSKAPPGPATRSARTDCVLSAIDHAPAMLERALAPIRAMTGGVLTVLWAGPVPDDGGAIGTFA